MKSFCFRFFFDIFLFFPFFFVFHARGRSRVEQGGAIFNALEGFPVSHLSGLGGGRSAETFVVGIRGMDIVMTTNISATVTITALTRA